MKGAIISIAVVATSTMMAVAAAAEDATAHDGSVLASRGGAPSPTLLAAHPVTTIAKYMDQINLYHFDNFGFEAGGEMLLDVNATLLSIEAKQLGRRVMLWLLACGERDFDVVTRRDLSRRIQYCENGAYHNRAICPLAWPLTVPADVDSNADPDGGGDMSICGTESSSPRDLLR